MEEKAAKRVVVRDTQRTVAIFLRERRSQKLRGYRHLNRDGETTEKPSVTVEPSYVEVPERPTERRRLATTTDVQPLKQTKNHRVQESSPSIRHNHTRQMSLSTSLRNTHLRHHRHHSHRKDSAAVRWVVLLASGRREIDPSKPEWSTTETREIFSLVQKNEVDMLIQDKQALLPLSAQQPSEVPRERIIPSRLIFVNQIGQSSQTSSVTARMTAQGDQEPDVLSLS